MSDESDKKSMIPEQYTRLACKRIDDQLLIDVEVLQRMDHRNDVNIWQNLNLSVLVSIFSNLIINIKDKDKMNFVDKVYELLKDVSNDLSSKDKEEIKNE